LIPAAILAIGIGTAGVAQERFDYRIRDNQITAHLGGGPQ
jgi:hypothetical protein